MDLFPIGFFCGFILLVLIEVSWAQHAAVSLSSGWHGRVEVLHAGVLGSVCDDDWDNNDCIVVCRQIGHSGGVAVREAALQYGEGTGRIWLDDVNCAGTENFLDDCEHDFWGTHNCLHKEDAGCTCDQPASAQNQGGSCDTSLHRLVEFDADQYPGVGRVEVRTSPSGQWYGVCDDKWDDAAAQVFCNCVGYSNLSSVHAFWSESVWSLGIVPMLYDSVQCDASHTAVLGNLHDCAVQPATGRCDSQEAAAVACLPPPHQHPPEAPTASLTCDGVQLNVCFNSSDYTLEEQYLSSQPACIKSTTSSLSQAVCLLIDMEVCDTATQHSDASSKHYCYDVSYTQYDADPATLLIDQVWTRRACCELAKNGSVSSSFEPLVVDHPSVLAQAPTSFSLQCFSDKTFSGSPLVFPAQVARGEDVYCRVGADTWDQNMYLVVPHCSFQATQAGTPSFQFHSNKCPTSASLGVTYYNFDGHHWGFRFPLPKFQGYGSVYVVCSTYVCDQTLDSKPYCDRSCSGGGRRRRHAPALTTPVSSGPFQVLDRGVGPLISPSGKLVMIPFPQHTGKQWPVERQRSEDKRQPVVTQASTPTAAASEGLSVNEVQSSSSTIPQPLYSILMLLTLLSFTLCIY